MTNSNNTYLDLVVGTNGVGKTTFVKEQIIKYLDEWDDDYKIILVDPQGTFPEIKSKRIIKPKLKKSAETLNNVSYETYFEKIYDSLIVIDDARIPFSDWQGRALMDLAINRRHKNVDIILIYHSLGEVQKTLYSTINTLYLFRVSESWSRIKRHVPYQVTEDIYHHALELPKYEKIEIDINP